MDLEADQLNDISVLRGARYRVDISGSDNFDFSSTSLETTAITGSQVVTVTGDSSDNSIVAFSSTTGGTGFYSLLDGNNTFLGKLQGDATVETGDGDDQISTTGAFRVTLNAGDGDDVFTATGLADDFVTTGNGADTINVGQGQDFIAINDNIDDMLANNHVDTVQGHYDGTIDSADTLNIFPIGAAIELSIVKVQPNMLTAVAKSNATDDLSSGALQTFATTTSINNFVTSNHDDYISITTPTVVTEHILIQALAGDDEITGVGENVTMDGGSGRDTITFSSTTHVGAIAYGGEDNDTIIGSGGNDEIHGDERSSVSFDFHRVPFGVTETFFYSQQANESPNDVNAAFTDGQDQLNGGGGFDFIFGGGEMDTIDAGDGGGYFLGGLGNDTITAIADGARNLIWGNNGDDDITLTGATNSIIEVNGGAGADDMIAPVGSTRAMLTYFNGWREDTEGVNVNLATGAASGGHATGDTFANFIDLEGSLFDDTLTGDTRNNKIIGRTGADVIDGLDGDDTLYGDSNSGTAGTFADVQEIELGDDIIHGGDGNDTIHGSMLLSVHFGQIGTLTDKDILYGDAGDDTIFGHLDDDTLIGGIGDDTLDGGIGADVLVGGADDDTYVVDDLGDSVTELAGEGTDTVYSSVSFVLSANVESLTLTGNFAIDGLGNGAANIIRGNDEDNGIAGGNSGDLLIGGGGNDSLDGQNGSDIMRGGTGSDGYHVDRVGDVVEEDFNGGEFDILRTAVTYTLPENVEIGIAKGGAGNPINITGNDGPTNDIKNLMLGNDSVNTITTFGGKDVILGRNGNDTINAGGERDNIAGGGGADIITGGSGDDNFNYVDIGDAGDLITDFAVSESDILDLRAMFDTFAGGSALDTNTAQAQGFLRLQDNGNSISVFADSDGTAGGNAEVLLALLNNITDDVSVVDNFILV